MLTVREGKYARVEQERRFLLAWLAEYGVEPQQIK
jgi:hypothetical protein